METNDVIDEREFSMGEILKCIGLWILIATLVTSCDKLSWFGNTNKISEWEGAPFRIHKYMSWGVFENTYRQSTIHYQIHVII